jgi:indolepyruvate ferredoxin oxidoreductase beta subunit
MNTKSVMICGVGGQGILLASDLLSQVALQLGLDVKKSEVHGMSQRGGTVISSIRFGEKVFSPLIGKGEADIILAFEKLEALRQIHFLKERGSIIVNNFVITPLPVACGIAEYPQNVIEVIKGAVPDATIVDGLALAKEAGNPRSMNVVLLGSLARKIKIDKGIFLDTIKKGVPAKTWKVNKQAFELGYAA